MLWGLPKMLNVLVCQLVISHCNQDFLMAFDRGHIGLSYDPNGLNISIEIKIFWADGPFKQQSPRSFVWFYFDRFMCYKLWKLLTTHPTIKRKRLCFFPFNFKKVNYHWGYFFGTISVLLFFRTPSRNKRKAKIAKSTSFRYHMPVLFVTILDEPLGHISHQANISGTPMADAWRCPTPRHLYSLVDQ